MSDTAQPASLPAPAAAPPPEAVVLDSLRQAMAARTPKMWVTIALAGLTLVAWLATAALGAGWWSPSSDGLMRCGAGYAPRLLGAERWRLLTASFLHAGPLHLALNLLALWAIGPLLERLLGSAGFLVVCVLCGLFGNLAACWWSPQVVFVGASATVVGLYAATLGFFVIERRRLPAPLLRDAWRSAIWFVIFNVLFGLSHAHVAMASYAGGLGGGFALGLLIAQPVDARGLRLHARNLAVAAFGLALVVLALVKLPRPPDLIAEERAFLAADARGVEAYNAAVMRWNQREINDAQMADTLDRDVLPAWRVERTRLDQVMQRKLSKEERTQLDRFARYLRARDQAWTLFADGLRTTDVEKTKRSAEQQKDAERVLKEPNGG